jgi:hypothetical protein
MTNRPRPTFCPGRTHIPLKSVPPDDPAALKRRIWRYGLSAAAMVAMGLIAASFLAINADALTVEPLPAVANPVSAVVDAVAAAVSHQAAAGNGEALPLAAVKRPAAIPAGLPETPRRAMLNRRAHKRHSRLHANPAAPYALHLGSFHSLKKARQGAARYRQMGISAHWQLMEKDHLYHLCAGKFETSTQAAHFKKDHGLGKAVIINAPLTVRVLPEQPHTTDADICRFLSKIGYDSLRERGLTNDTEIYTGLFSSLADASAVADRINDSGRFLAWVVPR